MTRDGYWFEPTTPEDAAFLAAVWRAVPAERRQEYKGGVWVEASAAHLLPPLPPGSTPMDAASQRAFGQPALFEVAG